MDQTSYGLCEILQRRTTAWKFRHNELLWFLKDFEETR